MFTVIEMKNAPAYKKLRARETIKYIKTILTK